MPFFSKLGRWVDNGGRDAQTRDSAQFHREHGQNRGTVRDTVPARSVWDLRWRWSLRNMIEKATKSRQALLRRPHRAPTVGPHHLAPGLHDEEHPEPT